MFFVRGLRVNGKEILVNPDQVLYVEPTGLIRSKARLVFAHRKSIIVDEDTETVRKRFEEYLHEVSSPRNDSTYPTEEHRDS